MKRKDIQKIFIVITTLICLTLLFFFFKDIIFDLDETLRFDGETGPYVQYTYVRTKALLEKAGFDISNVENVAYDLLQKQEEVEFICFLI